MQNRCVRIFPFGQNDSRPFAVILTEGKDLYDTMASNEAPDVDAIARWA